MYLLPKPKQIENKEGSFYLGYQSRIVIAPQIRENGRVYASVLQDCARTFAGLSLNAVVGEPGEGDIFLTLNRELSPQEYCLEIKEEQIIISGGDGAGIFYGTQTLCQIIEQSGPVLSCIKITDKPDLPHRGYYLDETRGRVLKLDYLKKAVDRLCRYKINELQLYVEHTYLFEGLSEMWRDETPLTAEEIMELDDYCRRRHVELVPSLSSFGHLYTLLSTKTCGELCEMENSWKQPFSYIDRMRHHTVNVGDERTLPLIKRMLEEYMSLFSTDKFNFCGDETFDLGKGKAKPLADEKGVHRIYIDYIKELCEFLVEKGKQPMFWGDVICGEPELVKELPENVICLTWGYAPDQSDEAARKMAQTGVKQYLCPGVSSWNHWMAHIEDSYQNIVRMCDYAQKYDAIGVLNTDWGDFGHIAHPEFSVPGMIYGAAFSWNHETIPYEEINRQISCVEFHDDSGKLVGLLAEIAGQEVIKWHMLVTNYEICALGNTFEWQPDWEKLFAAETQSAIGEAQTALKRLKKQIKETTAHMDSSGRGMTGIYEHAIDGVSIWNEVGAAVISRKKTEAASGGNGAEAGGLCLARSASCQEDYRMAERLETWFMRYKEIWRAHSKEGDLAHLGEIVFWYADLLRERERGHRMN